MKKRVLIVAMTVISVFAFSGCQLQQEMQMKKQEMQMKHINSTITSISIQREPQLSFNDLDRGVEVRVLPTQPANNHTGNIYHLSGKSFYLAPTAQYVRSMGLTEKYASMDYKLIIAINQADVDARESSAKVSLEVSLQDARGNEVFTQKAISSTSKGVVNYGLDEAYTQALEQINWNRIASFLRIADLPKDEPNKQVEGLGETALEQTIIRWDIQSRPQGADVSWRVVSKTPEVKTMSEKYLQTTPYEATKALDIRGLTYQNSGNVRIILRCQKDGYMPQEKEYNVRMVLDQEEISAFFRLVKEEE